MEENQHQLKLYAFFQNFIYLYIFIDIYLHRFSFSLNNNKVLRELNAKLYRVDFLTNPAWSHFVIFVIIIIISLAAKAKKNPDFHVHKHFTYPFLIGLGLFISNLLVLLVENNPMLLLAWITWVYALSYISGALLIQISFSNLTKYFKNNLKKDLWNVEEESFEQNRLLVQNEYLFNVPMQFYHKKKD